MKVMRLALILSLVAGSAVALPKPAEWSQSDWEKFIEAAVQIGLGEALSNAGKAVSETAGAVPLVDVYSALSAFGGSSTAGLALWLNRKQADAEIAGDHVRVDRYQAFQTCLVSRDCHQLVALAASDETSRRCRGGPFRPLAVVDRVRVRHRSLRRGLSLDCHQGHAERGR